MDTASPVTGFQAVATALRKIRVPKLYPSKPFANKFLHFYSLICKFSKRTQSFIRNRYKFICIKRVIINLNCTQQNFINKYIQLTTYADCPRVKLQAAGYF